MRGAICFAAALAIAAKAFAVTLDVARLQEPAFADREASGDAALPAGRTGADFRVFRLELTFASTPSNNVQVAFGRDNRPADGALVAEETDFIIGWDCGEWFLRPQGLRERFRRQIKQNFGPPRTEFLYHPVVTFSGKGVSTKHDLWGLTFNMDGKSTWDTIAGQSVFTLPNSSEILIELEVNTPDGLVKCPLTEGSPEVPKEVKFKLD